jgi:hypothetical protein
MGGCCRKAHSRDGVNRNDKTRAAFLIMAEPLPILVESSLQIAWEFLDGLGEVADPQETAEFLLSNINCQILKGERRRLALSNRAIDSYRQRQNPLQLDSCW